MVNFSSHKFFQVSCHFSMIFIKFFKIPWNFQVYSDFFQVFQVKWEPCIIQALAGLELGTASVLTVRARLKYVRLWLEECDLLSVRGRDQFSVRWQGDVRNRRELHLLHLRLTRHVPDSVNSTSLFLIAIRRACCNGLFPFPDSDTDSCTMQILWERDPNLNLSQWKHVLHNTM